MSNEDYGPLTGLVLLVEGGAKLIAALITICVVLAVFIVLGVVGGVGGFTCLHHTPKAERSARLFLVDNTQPVPNGFRCYEWRGGSYRCPVSAEVNVLCRPRPRGFEGYQCSWERMTP